MRDSWLDLVARVLRPARPRLEQCLRGRELHLEARRPIVLSRARAIARCEARLEEERAAVLKANDGVISARMRELEREWLTLSRPDPDGALMELWARIAPAGWIDRKRWRDSESVVPNETSVDAAIALAADVEGVEAAEAAASSLRTALSGWGIAIGSRIRWRLRERDCEHVSMLLAEPLRAARAALSTHDPELVFRALARAHALEGAVHEAARRRLPRRPHLGRQISHAAFVHSLLRAAALPDSSNPVTPLCDLWRTGYVLAAVDPSGVVLEIPPLER